MNRRDVIKSAAVPAGLLLSTSASAACPPRLVLDGPAPPALPCGPTAHPSWFAAAAEKEWINPRLATGQATSTQLQNITSGNIGNVTGSNAGAYPTDDHLINVWNAAITLPDYYAIVAQGGHNKSSDNGVYVFGPFSSENPQWVRALTSEFDLVQPSGGSTAWTASGRPASRHGYNNETYIPDLGGGVGHQWFSVLASGPYGAGGGSGATQSYNFGADPQQPGTYNAEGFDQNYPPGPSRLDGGASAWDPVSQRVYFTSYEGANSADQENLHEFNPFTRTWTTTQANNPGFGGGFGPLGGVVDPVRGIFVVYLANRSSLHIYDISAAHKGEWVQVTAGDPTNDTSRPGLAYEPIGGKVVAWDGGQTLKALTVPAGFRNGTEDPAQPITVTSGWSWDTVTGVSGVTPPGAASTGTWSKFGYIASIGALACQSGAVRNDMFCFKVPVTGL